MLATFFEKGLTETALVNVFRQPVSNLWSPFQNHIIGIRNSQTPNAAHPARTARDVQGGKRSLREPHTAMPCDHVHFRRFGMPHSAGDRAKSSVATSWTRTGTDDGSHRHITDWEGVQYLARFLTAERGGGMAEAARLVHLTRHGSRTGRQGPPVRVSAILTGRAQAVDGRGARL